MKNAKTVTISKTRASTFMSDPSPGSVHSARSRTGEAVGVERLGGRGSRAAQLAAVHLLQRFGGGVRLAGLLVHRTAQLHVLVVLVRRQCSQLEVHHRVVGTAQLGAAPDERTFPIDLGDLERVVLVVALR